MGHGSGRDVHRPASQKHLSHGFWPNVYPKCGADDGSGAMDEHRSKVALADPADVFLSSARLDARRQPKPRGEVAC
jgi:hypothetical protein